MKTALAQLDIIWENKEANKITAVEFIKKAAKNNCDIIIFPEMSLTGFSMNIDIIAEKEENSETVKFFCEQAAENNIYITFGIALTGSDGKTRNYAITCNRQGQIVSKYAKIHPFSHGVEHKYFVGGDHIEWFDLDGVTASTFVCYDTRFPEIFQAASMKSKLIIVIACWPDVRTEHWETLLKARALENQCYICGVNRTGREMKYTYNGHSLVASPYGRIISDIREDEALIITEFDIAEVDKYRHDFAMKSDRRPDIYKKYL